MDTALETPPTLPRKAPARETHAPAFIPPLENGAHLTASEFLRRYEAMPQLKKAELIQGIVYMGWHVRADKHGSQDNVVQGISGLYVTRTPNVEAYSHSTLILGIDDVPQPDVILRLDPEHGGKSRINEEGFIAGAPELIVEVAETGASIDCYEKLQTYRRFGVPEYLLWRVEDEHIVLLHLDEDGYKPIEPGEDGIVRSIVFPGLWFDFKAMLSRELERVIAVLDMGLKSPEDAAFLK